MKLLVRSPMREEDLKEVSRHFDEVVYDPWTVKGERWWEDECLEKLLEIKPDAMITELDELTEKVLDGYRGLKWIGDCRATPENINVEKCAEYGIPLICTPGRNAQAVAEIWLGLVITLMRNIPASIRWMREGNWVLGTTPYFLFMGNEVMYKKVAFLGMGAVARHIVNLLKPLECEIRYFDPFVEEFDPDVRRVETPDELFGWGDIVSVHLPVTESTKKMVSKERLGMMKKEAIFVNTARAWAVDSDALYDTLKEKLIRGAVIDVFENEPPKEEDMRFMELENAIVTPHICGATYEIADHQSRIMADRVRRFYDGEGGRGLFYNARGLEKYGWKDFC